MRSVLRRFLRWITADERPSMPRPTCPVCGREVVGGVGAPGRSFRFGGGGFGYITPNRAELVAHCPVHGHPPYNRPTAPG